MYVKRKKLFDLFNIILLKRYLNTNTPVKKGKVDVSKV